MTFTSVIILLIVIVFASGCLCKTPGHRLLGADAWVLRLDADGSEIWKTVIDNDDKNALAIAETDDSGFVVSGGRMNLSTVVSSPWMTKLDKNGKIVWDRTYNFSYDDKVTSFAQKDGEIFGITYTGTLFRTDPDGNIRWERRNIGEPGWWRILTTSNGFIASNEEKMVLLDEKGNSLDQIIHSPKSITPVLFETGADNNTIIAYGSTENAGRELYVKNLNESGNIIWSIVASKDDTNWPILLYEPSPGRYDIIFSNNSELEYSLNRLEIGAKGDIISYQKIKAISPIINTKDNGLVYAGFGDSEADVDGDKRTGIFGKLPPLSILKMDINGEKQWITKSDPGDYWYIWYFFYPEPVNRKVISITQTNDEGFAVLVKTYKI